MTSWRQFQANRLNAFNSTGPRTEEGKRISRRNALRHGLTAETVIDPPEGGGRKIFFEKQPQAQSAAIFQLIGFVIDFDSADSASFRAGTAHVATLPTEARANSTTMKSKKSERAGEPKYRANARERAVIEKHLRRMAEAAPRLKVVGPRTKQTFHRIIQTG
jgi:hypothetical protein